MKKLLTSDVYQVRSSYMLDDISYKIRFNSIYNIYNFVAVISAVSLYNINTSTIQTALAKFVLNNGRLEETEINGIPTIINLAKNPTGSNVSLRILNEDDAHGYRIVQEIKDRSDGRLIIKEGSLYPILYKLSDEGYIISQEDISETKLGRKRIRVIYSITPKGREHLIQLKEEYDIVHDSIRCIFERSKSL